MFSSWPHDTNIIDFWYSLCREIDCIFSPPCLFPTSVTNLMMTYLFLHQWHWYWRQFSLNQWMTWSTNQLLLYMVFSVNLFLNIIFFFFSNFLFISCKEMSSSHLQFFCLFSFINQFYLLFFFIFWMSKKIPWENDWNKQNVLKVLITWF